jgi:hypothetical protein
VQRAWEAGAAEYMRPVLRMPSSSSVWTALKRRATTASNFVERTITPSRGWKEVMQLMRQRMARDGRRLLKNRLWIDTIKIQRLVEYWVANDEDGIPVLYDARRQELGVVMPAREGARRVATSSTIRMRRAQCGLELVAFVTDAYMQARRDQDFCMIGVSTKDA